MHPVAKKSLLYGLLPASVAIAIIFGVGSMYASAYVMRIYPGVFVGPVDVGGLTREQATEKINAATADAIADGLVVSVNNEMKTLPLVSTGDTSFDLVSWNVDAAVSDAEMSGRNRGAFMSTLSPITFGLGFHHGVNLETTINTDQLTTDLDQTFSGVNTPAVDAGFMIASDGSDSWSIKTTESHDGQIMETGLLFDAIRNHLSSTLTLPPLAITVTNQTAQVTTNDAESLIDMAQIPLANTPYVLTFAPPDAEPSTWELSAQDIASYLQPERKDEVSIGLGLEDGIMEVIKERTKTVIHPPADAKFEIKNGKVVEFQGARGGWTIDETATMDQLESVLGMSVPNPETDPITIVIVANYEDATVQTSDVNDLGITQILGVGESNFSGSPTNRIKNIKNGAALVNGTLIKPGDTFSLLAALSPFTIENGYLPELVIKGDKIQPEIGGGLCQIGTTTFRGAMNAGLPIVERRNHSLVVSYYNDPRNKSPGTDATIYEPSPDLKFTNDTGHYVLITTAMDTTTGALAFTFWGTSDGRQGSYSEPIVSSWISAGPTRNIETLDLAPGTSKCQHAYPGANASFVYSVVQADGTVVTETFSSSYRALPEICLVGVEKLTEPEAEVVTEEGDPEAATESTPTEDAPVEEPLSEEPITP